MDNVILYVDDAAHARLRLATLATPAAQRPRHWIVVVCPPRMARHVSKWVHHTARQNWRDRWSQRLLHQLVPALRATGERVTTVVAEGPLHALSRELIEHHGPAQVLDLRRPKFDAALPVIDATPPSAHTPAPG